MVELPTDIGEFRSLVRRCFGDHQRLLALSEACTRSHVRTVRRRGTAATRRVARRLYESRLIELVRSPIVERGSGVGLVSSQFEACNALVHLRSRELATVMKQWSRSPRAAVRAEAAQYTAWLGFSALVPATLRAIQSADLRVCEAAIQGAGLAAIHKLSNRLAQRRLFNAITPLVTGRRRVRGSHSSDLLWTSTEALVQLDRRRAIDLLSSDACLSPSNECVYYTLERLDSYQVECLPARMRRPVDPSLLWTVHDAARAGKLNGPSRSRRDRVLGLTIKLAARADPVRAAREARAARKLPADPWSPLRNLVREALRICRGVPEPGAALRAMNRCPDHWAAPAVEVLRAYELAEHAITDSLAVYFHNLGPSWTAAASGLHRLALPDCARLLTKAALAIATDPHRLTAREWSQAYEELAPASNKQVRRLEAQFDRAAVRIIPAVERFIGANAPLFHRGARASPVAKHV